MRSFPQLIEPAPAVVQAYWEVFINQPAYSVMTDDRENPATNRYYRPLISPQSTTYRVLKVDTIRRHLRGEITCMFYAADPLTQRSKWVCVDADYQDADLHLNLLRNGLLDRGVDPLLETSRRGGHLWFFCAEPLKSVQLRAFMLDLLGRLAIPVSAGDASRPGVELFPRQDFLESDRLGNGIRGPLGVHRKDFERYWFLGADHTLEAQMKHILEARKVEQARLDRLTEDMALPCRVAKEARSTPKLITRPVFSILDHFPVPSQSGADYKVECPACASKRLVITSRGPKRGYYHCFSGCSTESIRAALGQPMLKRGT